MTFSPIRRRQLTDWLTFWQHTPKHHYTEHKSYWRACLCVCVCVCVFVWVCPSVRLFVGTRLFALGNMWLCVLVLQFRCVELEQASVRSGGLPVAFTSQRSTEGIRLCCCVLLRSIDIGLQGSVQGQRKVPGCMYVCVCVCVCKWVCVWWPGDGVSERRRWVMAGQRTMSQWALSVEGSLTSQHLQVTEKDWQTVHKHIHMHTLFALIEVKTTTQHTHKQSLFRYKHALWH